MFFVTLLILCCVVRVLPFTCDGNFPDPEYGHKYYECQKGTATRKNCPVGQTFNGTKCSQTKSLAASTEAANYAVFCYYESWAGYRQNETSYPPNRIDTNLCTHVVYAFAKLDPDTKKIKQSDPYLDEKQGYYKKVVELKRRQPSLKVLISVGGWLDNQAALFSEIAATAVSRRSFANAAVDFVTKHGFDGMEINWEYPGCPPGGCQDDSRDKDNFSILLMEIWTRFAKKVPSPMLTAAVSASPYYIDKSYDVPEISRTLDYINVMTYAYSVPTDKITGQNAPFNLGPGKSSVVSSMQYWEAKGAPAKKLLLSVPFYGISYTLKESREHAFGAPAVGPGTAGEITIDAGGLAYFEVCKRVVHEGWRKGGDAKTGPYAYKGDQWVGYDDPAMIKRKAQYIIERGYAGAGLWDVSMDCDGSCCGVTNPLLNVLNYELRGRGVPISQIKCQ